MRKTELKDIIQVWGKAENRVRSLYGVGARTEERDATLCGCVVKRNREMWKFRRVGGKRDEGESDPLQRSH